MADKRRNSTLIQGNDVTIETYIDGEGPAFVILPSYGRDSGTDYDPFVAHLVQAGWKALRPQPRGIAGSKGPMTNVSLRDLADDVALCIRRLGDGSAVVLGHAFGHAVAKVTTTGGRGLELQCRLVEAMTGEPRPSHMTAKEAVERFMTPETRETSDELARVTALYFVECFAALMPSQISTALH